jgi:hypothetical protein
MAISTVPEVMANLQALLLARPALAGVAVNVMDPGWWPDAEMIVFVTAQMAGASFLGWGAGPQSGTTVEPLTLNGYSSVDLAGNTNDEAKQAQARNAVLLAELVAVLQEHPDLDGALSGRRWRQPLLATASWDTWVADSPQGAKVVRSRVVWTVAWQALG